MFIGLFENCLAERDPASQEIIGLLPASGEVKEEHMKKKSHTKPAAVHQKKKENPPIILWMPLAALVFFIVVAVTWRVMTTSAEISSKAKTDVQGASISTSDLTREVESFSIPDDKEAFESLKKDVKGL
ncbi:MAG: hypothetical protein AAB508_05380 [Patescibacteria group bacterium]